MKMVEAFRMAFRTIRVQKLKSFFSLIGVLIGVTFLIAVVSIVQGLNRYMVDRFANTLIGANTFELRQRPSIVTGNVTRRPGGRGTAGRASVIPMRTSSATASRRLPPSPSTAPTGSRSTTIAKWPRTSTWSGPRPRTSTFATTRSRPGVRSRHRKSRAPSRTGHRQRDRDKLFPEWTLSASRSYRRSSLPRDRSRRQAGYALRASRSTSSRSCRSTHRLGDSSVPSTFSTP